MMIPVTKPHKTGARGRIFVHLSVPDMEKVWKNTVWNDALKGRIQPVM